MTRSPNATSESSRPRGVASPGSLYAMLVRQSLYPLVANSILAVAILLARVGRTGRMTYVFLVWNLFLAWVPYVCSSLTLWLRGRHPARVVPAIVLSIVWLAFFPNAPYIVTDFVHLRPRALIPVWYDIGMLLAFAINGVLLSMVSLAAMQSIVRRRAGPVLAWIFASTVCLLSGFGIYLGRVLRWNSWDLLVRPGNLVDDAAAQFSRMQDYPPALGFTGIFGAILLVCYVFFATLQPPVVPSSRTQ